MIMRHADALQKNPETTEAGTKTSRKRTLPEPKSPAKKRVKVDSSKLDGTPSDQPKAPYLYQTIKAIKMPPRTTTGPPAKGDKQYGEEKHENSMLIYWLDEQDKSYNEATQLFAQMFPAVKVVEEAIRRRHIRALNRLSSTYGVKELHEIEGVGKNAMRRGKTRKPRTAKIRVESSPDDTGDSTDGGTATRGASSTAKGGAATKSAGKVPKYVKHQSFKAIEKAAIVVWKDLEGKSFKEIRDKLDDEFDWSLGRGTVEKMYHLSRPKVYGALNGRILGGGDDTPAEEDVDAGDEAAMQGSAAEDE